jgi:hypothetical protein
MWKTTARSGSFAVFLCPGSKLWISLCKVERQVGTRLQGALQTGFVSSELVQGHGILAQ